MFIYSKLLQSGDIYDLKKVMWSIGVRTSGNLLDVGIATCCKEIIDNSDEEPDEISAYLASHKGNIQFIKDNLNFILNRESSLVNLLCLLKCAADGGHYDTFNYIFRLRTFSIIYAELLAIVSFSRNSNIQIFDLIISRLIDEYKSISVRNSYTISCRIGNATLKKYIESKNPKITQSNNLILSDNFLVARMTPQNIIDLGLDISNPKYLNVIGNSAIKHLIESDNGDTYARNILKYSLVNNLEMAKYVAECKPEIEKEFMSDTFRPGIFSEFGSVAYFLSKGLKIRGLDINQVANILCQKEKFIREGRPWERLDQDKIIDNLGKILAYSILTCGSTHIPKFPLKYRILEPEWVDQDRCHYLTNSNKQCSRKKKIGNLCNQHYNLVQKDLLSR